MCGEPAPSFSVSFFRFCTDCNVICLSVILFIFFYIYAKANERHLRVGSKLWIAQPKLEVILLLGLVSVWIVYNRVTGAWIC